MHEKILELARRRLGQAEPPRLLDRLRGPSAQGTGLPEAWNEGIRSFYELLDPDVHGPCVGTACRYARGEVTAAAPAALGARGVRCLGRCFEGPADAAAPPRPIPRRALTAEPVVLRHLLGAGAAGAAVAGGDGRPGAAGGAAGATVVDDRAEVWDDYDLPDGAAILRAVEAWGLRGRGGAAYPTAAKWKVARETVAADRLVVANGDEGDPGAYVDRLLLEETPHSVLAGMLACARAIGASRGIVYIRAEYPVAVRCVSAAIAEASARGVLAGFDVEVLVGAGSYVAGEETALLRSIEGLRAEPSPKPPYPAVRGLFGLPTIVQNVETLSVVPYIARRAASCGASAADGAGGQAGAGGTVPSTPAGACAALSVRRRDTKAVCLSGAVARPGIVEIDLGTPLRRVLEDGGGGPAHGKRWKMALVGGPLGRVVAEKDFDVAMSFDALPGMGHAGVVVFDESVSARALAVHLFEFARGESCGTCAPCRIGTAQLGSCTTRASLERLLATIGEGSLCGFGQGVPRPILDLLAAFGDEVLA